MRLFVALDLRDEIRERIRHFVEEMRELAPSVRWVSPESLHVTLKFIGEKPDAMVKEIGTTLGSVSSSGFRVSFRGCGFFPTAKSARVFWVGIEAEAGLAQLAAKVEGALAGIGVPAEKRAFSPHLTLARAGGSSGAPNWRKGDKANPRFANVQKRLSEIQSPDFGTMSAREFFLYRSQLSSKGARYTKITRFALTSQEP
jgi:RNA 2',3'-cyclic 3'-phosphodiesterase